MKLGLVAASLVLVAGGAVGCGSDDGGGDGGSDGGSKAASVDDFCGAFQAFYDDVQDIDGTEDNLGEILKKAAQRIEDVGTPEDIPDDAKEGLQITLDKIQELPDDASVDDMGSLEDDLSEADKKKTDAFSTYLDDTCPDLGSEDSSSDSGSDSGSGSDSPTEEPS